MRDVVMTACRVALAFACLGAPVVACHTMSYSPQDLDALHARCEAQIVREGGPHAVTPSAYVGVRTPADPPGTPVTIYGASWCSACKVAEQYMKRRDIPFVERDVEEDPSAKAALASATTAAGLGREVHVLPVLDVRGTVVVGFNPCVVEQAWSSN
jgi:glutaredoxin